MSDPNQNDSNEQEHDLETDVEGVDTNPDDKKKSIEVDTNERLENKDRNLDDVPDDELHQERDERLDPDQRPDGAEVDNSDRTFNPETGLFEDSDIDPPEGAPFATTEAEQSNNGSDGSDSTDSAAPDGADQTHGGDRADGDRAPQDTDRRPGGAHAAR